MIGGCDETVEHNKSPGIVIEVLDIVVGVWGDAVFQFAIDTLYCYKNIEACNAWRNDGWTEQYGNEMISCIIEHNAIHLTYDDRIGDIECIIDAIMVRAKA